MGIDVADPDRTVNELTLAQRQMVEIAKVMARNPKVVILDEATSALGRAQADWLIRYCRGLAADGKIIIYISHKLSEIRGVADRITVFRNGVNVSTSASEEQSTDEVVSLMLGRIMDRLYPPRNRKSSQKCFWRWVMLPPARVRGVSFSLRQGEILGVGGLTGQGQDELFLAPFMACNQGLVGLCWTGNRLRSGAPMTRSISALPWCPRTACTHGLLFPKSVADNITLSVLPKLLGMGFINRVAERGVVRNAIDRFSIAVCPSDPVERLSGGNQQKVVLAKLLATQPKVLMMFDSTRGVDVRTKAESIAFSAG